MNLPIDRDDTILTTKIDNRTDKGFPTYHVTCINRNETIRLWWSVFAGFHLLGFLIAIVYKQYASTFF